VGGGVRSPPPPPPLLLEQDFPDPTIAVVALDVGPGRPYVPHDLLVAASELAQKGDTLGASSHAGATGGERYQCCCKDRQNLGHEHSIGAAKASVEN
jgi:hypothetical protein